MRHAVASLLLLTTLSLSGCATRAYVTQRVQTSEQQSSVKIAEVQTDVEAVQAEISKLHQTDERLAREIAAASEAAKDALRRAQEAAKLAAGRFLYETTLTDEEVRFGLNQSELSDQAKAALDTFAAPIKQANHNVFIEIQGHTDNLGSEATNLQLGLRRAEQVKRYLVEHHGFPAHRVDTITYGESKPIADNATAQGRSRNRRVTLIVLE
jgi:peptidoglycan-associated lipoprotein